MMKDPRYEVDNPMVEDLLKKLGTFLGERLPEGWGFTLFLVAFGKGGATFYISNIRRSDMIATLQEFIRRQQ